MSKASSLSSRRLGVLGILIVLGLIGGSASAWADKPKIAVLGLEVTPGPGGSVDPATTQVAREITKELRARAQAGSSPYMIAPNSNKELTDEKLLLSCDNEGKDCMAVIGAGLAADMLMFGRVEKRGDTYRVTIKLLDVKTKSLESRNDELALGGSVAGVSKRLYGKLIVDVGASTIVVVAHSDGNAIDSGRVIVDEEKVGELTGGKLTVGGVSEGRHTVAIEAGGFRRFEQTIMVRAGQPAKVDAALVTRDGGGSVASSGSHLKAWKIALGTSIGVAVIGAAMWIGGAVEQNRYIDTAFKANPGVNNLAVSPSECGHDEMTLRNDHKDQIMTFNSGAFHTACNWHTVNTAGVIVTSVAGAVAITSLVMVLLDHSGNERTASILRKSNLAIVPVVSPEQTGASLSLRW